MFHVQSSIELLYTINHYYDGSSQSFGGLTAQIGWFGLRVGGHPALSLHSSNEPDELSQWLCHDDSTINIVVVIIIIIIIIIITIRRCMHEMCCFFAVRQLYVVKESDELRYTFNARPVYVRPTSENFLK